MRKFRRGRILNLSKGFTLIELLIVMGILGLLIVLGASNFQSARIKARDTKRKSDLATIAKSLEAYVNDYGRYPLSSSGLIVCQSPATTCAWGDAMTDGKSIYAAALPEDSSANREYVYESSSGTSFTLYASLENANDPAFQTFTPSVACGGENCNYKVTSPNTN